eukprot:g5504.t1
MASPSSILSPVCTIVGGTKGIGLAMAKEWIKKQKQIRNDIMPKIYLLGRSINVKENKPLDTFMKMEYNEAIVKPVHIDLTEPESIESTCKYVCNDTETLDYLFHTAGMLHNIDNNTGKQMLNKPRLPERSLKGLSYDGMLQTFQLNTIAPGLVIKGFSDILKKSHRNGYRSLEQNLPPVVAALSARVGSISDNGKGGWTSYRASKAALNMILLNAHIEFGMGPEQKVIVMSLHPGTVDTGLSQPFQQIAAKQYEIFTPEHSASMLVDLCIKSDETYSGNFYAYDGSSIPY